MLIIDDGSTEDVQGVAQEFARLFAARDVQLSYARMPFNAGVSRARNEGWRRAKNDYLAFLDSDDLWHPAKLRICAEALTVRASPHSDVLFHSFSQTCTQEFWRTELAFSDYRIREVGASNGLLHNFSATPCFVVRRDINERFDESMRYCEDQDLWLRISRRIPLLQLVGPPLTSLGRPLMSPGGLSSRRHRMRLGEIRMYSKFCIGSVWFPVLPALIIWSLLKHSFREVRHYGSRSKA